MACRQALREGRVRLLVVAQDASEGAARYWQGEAERAGAVRVIRWGTRVALGSAMGRGPVAVIGVCDEGLAFHFLGSVSARDASGRSPAVQE